MVNKWVGTVLAYVSWQSGGLTSSGDNFVLYNFGGLPSLAD